MTRRDLTPWSPHAELRTMRGLWNPNTWPFGNDNQMDLDVYDADGLLTIEADLPGIASGDVHVSIHNGVLSIHARHHDERKIRDEAWYLHECRAGSMTRSIRLPGDVDASQIEATQHDGHLTITVPRTQQDEAHHVRVTDA